MFELIALTGKPYSGKTTLAHALEDRGYMVISFTDLLKELAVEALGACGVVTTLDEIKDNKSRFRPFLQELGSVIGFNDDPGFVTEALMPWYQETNERRETHSPDRSVPLCVFDNVRTPEQWEALKAFGFKLVRLEVTELAANTRAFLFGHSDGVSWNHPIEHALDLVEADITFPYPTDIRAMVEALTSEPVKFVEAA